MKITVYANEDTKNPFEVECSVLPRIGDHMILEGTQYYDENDYLGSYLTVAQVLHIVKNGIVSEIGVWINRE